MSLLEVAREGFLLILSYVPQGSDAEIDPRRAESLRERVGLREGLLEGDASETLMGGEDLLPCSGAPRGG